MIGAAAANIGVVSSKEDVHRQALAAASAAASKKGDDIILLDVGEIIGITDYFVIASGANDRQVKTIVDEVEEQLRDGEGTEPLRVEGGDERRWVLMDYGDFWVHVFLDETRTFYDLERLWADAPREEYDDGEAAAG